MRSIGHFIGGKEVKGTSGRTADVFEPMTGDVQAKVALASKAEVRAAVENAALAQVEWANTNPQRPRARDDEIPRVDRQPRNTTSSRRPAAGSRAWQDACPIPRAIFSAVVEVVEFACGVPHLMKGEYTEGAGPGIDLYSMRQPLGVVAGITPFNFPAMIPLWKCAPAIACGNAFILKPSERDPIRADADRRIVHGGRIARPASSMLSTATRKRSIPSSTDPRHHGGGLCRLDPDRAIHLCHRAAQHRKALLQCFGGAKNHMPS